MTLRHAFFPSCASFGDGGLWRYGISNVYDELLIRH